MHKLVILIEPLEDYETLEEGWPQFLRAAEAMPGLKREATSRVVDYLYGAHPVIQIHELFFETQDAAHQAMSSPEGRQAGRILQQITGGRMVLLFADHKEDNLENILKYRSKDGDEKA